MFRKAAAGLGYHPFPEPSSNLSQPYTNPEGMKLNACVFCGFCERHACEHYAKSAPQTVILPVLLANPNFELRTGCQVQKINLDSTKQKATIGATNSTGRPIQYHPVPPGTATWGKGWKQAVLKHYNRTVMIGLHGSSIAQKQNYLDLDPTYRDAWGQPLLRMTFDFPRNDLKMAEYVTAKAVEIGKAMGAKQVVGNPRRGPYTTTQYQSTHNTGGAVMGDDPKTSVVNRYLQSWDVPNVFVIGACAYPQNASWNPTGTLGALTYWAIDALKNQYMKNPGPLVSV
jgi:choline dehydrogenase-like flavoprotein